MKQIKQFLGYATRPYKAQADSTLTFRCTYSLRPQSVCEGSAACREPSRVTYLPRCVYKLEMIFLPIYCDQLCESYKERE